MLNTSSDLRTGAVIIARNESWFVIETDERDSRLSITCHKLSHWIERE